VSIGALFRIAWDALARNAGRSLLTMLGIIIGVAAVITALAIGAGVRAAVAAQLQGLGSNLVIVVPGSTTTGGVALGAGARESLKLDDATAIAHLVPGVAGVSPQSGTSAQVVAGNANWATSVSGVSSDWPRVQNWTLAQGRFFTPDEQRDAAKVAVLGSTVAANLFPSGNAIGAVIVAKRVPFTVIGVLNAKGQSGFGRDQDDQVVIPITSLQTRITGNNWLNSIVISATSTDIVDSVVAATTRLLRLRHHLTPKQPDDFSVRNISNVQQAFTQTSQIMSLLLASIATISLIVGGIGIMNIMLVSVTERTREIGIRLAVGAHARHILTQFLIEALTLSCIGGVIGIALGVVASLLASSVGGWNILVAPSAVLLSFCFSALVGIIFGYYPARRAALLDPIDALRHE
jgi:putative ABC transport system permease protein